MQVIPALQPVIFGGRGFTIEAKTLFAAMNVKPPIQRKIVINDCIVALKNGGVWSELDGLAVFAAADSQAALLNWINPGTFDFTANNAPTFTANVGYTGNGTNAFLSCSYNLSSSGGQYAQNAATIFGWDNSTAQDGKAFMGLNASTGAPGMRLYSRYTDDN